jgi:hypothetical protein
MLEMMSEGLALRLFSVVGLGRDPGICAFNKKPEYSDVIFRIYYKM